MERGEPPFDNIRLVPIGHNRIDRYSPSFTVRFLQHNPHAVVVTTSEVRAQLKKNSSAFDQIQARVVVPELEWRQSAVREIDGIRLEIARLKHDDDKERACALYVFLFDLDGKRVLFAPATTGFFPEEYETLGYSKRGIDLAFVNFHLMIRPGAGGVAAMNSAGTRQVRDLIGPQVPVMNHIRPERLPFVEEMLPDLREQLPTVTLFRQLLETLTF